MQIALNIAAFLLDALHAFMFIIVHPLTSIYQLGNILVKTLIRTIKYFCNSLPIKAELQATLIAWHYYLCTAVFQVCMSIAHVLLDIAWGLNLKRSACLDFYFIHTNTRLRKK
jgi:hypothetical protein